MGLFDQLGCQPLKQPLQGQQADPRQAQQAFQNDLARLKADPIAYAKAHGKNIPENMTDPSQMLQYLLNNTPVNNPRSQLVLSLLNRMHG